MPVCDVTTDRFCLATETRSSFKYRMLEFPALYLHFWSLGSPAAVNVCGPFMKRRHARGFEPHCKSIAGMRPQRPGISDLKLSRWHR